MQRVALIAAVPAIALAMADAVGVTERLLALGATTPLVAGNPRAAWLVGAQVLMVAAWLGSVAARALPLAGWVGAAAGLLAAGTWGWFVLALDAQLRDAAAGVSHEVVTATLASARMYGLSSLATALNLMILGGLGAQGPGARIRSLPPLVPGLILAACTGMVHLAAVGVTSAANAVVWGIPWAATPREVSLVAHAVLVPLGLAGITVAAWWGAPDTGPVARVDR